MNENKQIKLKTFCLPSFPKAYFQSVQCLVTFLRVDVHTVPQSDGGGPRPLHPPVHWGPSGLSGGGEQAGPGWVVSSQ